MNSKGIVAIRDTKNLCFKCLQRKDNIRNIHIGVSGYGSAFDNMGTSLQLCEKCYAESTKDNPIWNMERVYGLMHFNEYTPKSSIPKYCFVEENIDKRYLYDYEMSEYLQNLPLEGREIVYNRNAYGACADFNMTPQDYIDFELDELPHKKCKQYGFYSPQEKAAYKERFPNCNCVVINKFKDGSQASSCPYGARGNEKGDVDLNIWDECYMCTHYQPRKGDIQVVNKVKEYYRHEKDRLIYMLQFASTRLRELEDSVEDYMDKHHNN